MGSTVDSEAVDPAEATIRAQLDAGDLRAAATTAIQQLGPGVFGYLRAVLRDEDLAADVFAEVCAVVWTDLARFDGPSVRAWMLVIARHRVLRTGRAAARARKHSPLSRSPELVALADQARTSTAAWRRTDNKDAIARLRDALEPDDQTLLVLRLDRGMSWREVAHVMELGEAAVRKRFERLVTKLREQARAAKLIS